MIERLVISRFRGIRKGVLKDLGKFNLIVGPNNSGKTAVLEALYLLSVAQKRCRLFGGQLPIDGLEVVVPINNDILGYLPCPRIWKRHGKNSSNEVPPYSWHKPPGNVLDDGSIAYKIPHIENNTKALKQFRLIPPISEDIYDIERFEDDSPKTICSFVLKNPEGIDDILKQYLPDLYPQVFGNLEFLFSWDEIIGKDSVRLIEFLKQKYSIDWIEQSNIEKLDDKTIRVMQKKYLFNWDEVPGNDSERLIEFISNKYGINWLKKAKINKNEINDIIISNSNNYISLSLNERKKKVDIKIDDGRTGTFSVKIDNDKRNIYEKKRILLSLDIEKTKLNLKINDGRTDKFSVKRGDSKLNIYHLNKLDRNFAFTWYQDFIYNYESLGLWASEGIIPDAECVLFFDFHDTSGHFTQEFYQSIRIIPDWRIKLTQAFGNVFDLGKFTVNIEPHPYVKNEMQGTIEPESKKPIPIDDFGDGARHAFKVLAALTVLADRCKDGKEGIFLWEDPELFMHPESMRHLLNQIMDIVQEKHIQVFICTQSIEFILCFTKLLKEREKLQENIRVFRLDIRDGELFNSCFKYPNLRAWVENDMDIRFWNQLDTILHFNIGDERGEDLD